MDLERATPKIITALAAGYLVRGFLPTDNGSLVSFIPHSGRWKGTESL
jgi:hypothetical protein